VDFGAAWTAAAATKAMQDVQDSFVQKTVFRPAMEWAYRLNLKTAYSKALMYDSEVQMGGPGDPLKIMRPQFAQSHGGRDKPASLDEELEWDALYQAARKHVLDEDPTGASTDTRVLALTQVGFPTNAYGADPSASGFELTNANPNLNLPIQFLYAGVATPFVITVDTK
jgi:hypothetical protein